MNAWNSAGRATVKVKETTSKNRHRADFRILNTTKQKLNRSPKGKKKIPGRFLLSFQKFALDDYT